MMRPRWPAANLRSVNVLLAAVVVVAAAGLAIGALLFVRRRAPDGSYFSDGDRASGFFGVIATGFAVLLGLIVVLAFTSYDESRTGAETEALTVAQQYEVAHLLPPAGGPAPRRRADLLQPFSRSPGVATNAERNPDRRDEPVGRRAVPHASDDRPAQRVRAGGLREMARSAPRPRGGARRSNPRCGRGDPGATVASPVRDRHADRRLHDVLRRQRGTADRAGGARRHGRRDDDRDPARHRLSRQPVPARAWQPPAGRDETDVATPRPGTPRSSATRRRYPATSTAGLEPRVAERVGAAVVDEAPAVVLSL